MPINDIMNNVPGGVGFLTGSGGEITDDTALSQLRMGGGFIDSIAPRPVGRNQLPNNYSNINQLYDERYNSFATSTGEPVPNPTTPPAPDNEPSALAQILQGVISGATGVGQSPEQMMSDWTGGWGIGGQGNFGAGTLSGIVYGSLPGPITTAPVIFEATLENIRNGVNDILSGRTSVGEAIESAGQAVVGKIEETVGSVLDAPGEVLAGVGATIGGILDAMGKDDGYTPGDAAEEETTHGAGGTVKEREETVTEAPVSNTTVPVSNTTVPVMNGMGSDGGQITQAPVASTTDINSPTQTQGLLTGGGGSGGGSGGGAGITGGEFNPFMSGVGFNPQLLSRPEFEIRNFLTELMGDPI